LHISKFSDWFLSYWHFIRHMLASPAPDHWLLSEKRDYLPVSAAQNVRLWFLPLICYLSLIEELQYFRNNVHWLKLIAHGVLSFASKIHINAIIPLKVMIKSFILGLIFTICMSFNESNWEFWAMWSPITKFFFNFTKL
jgi:hypothetical protein